LPPQASREVLGVTTVATKQQQPIRSTIPARLDRLRWSPFHTRVVLGLGTAWILDGLEITIASSVTSKLTQANTLALSTTQASAIGTVYLVGEVVGALVFGRLSDKLGRRKLFMWTLTIYLIGTGLSALAFRGGGGIVYFYLTRFIAGTGIGGEYSAVNSAVDEMMPARYRGRTDIWINGSYWLGSIIGTFASFLLLNSLAPDLGWRIGFLVGPVLAFAILFIRRDLPESPRWLLTHGRDQEAEASMRHIEEVSIKDGQYISDVPDSAGITIRPEKEYGYLTLLRVIMHTYPKRAVLGGTLMITQSFLYNAIFFTYSLVLTKFYNVSSDAVPIYGLAFAVGNLAGPLLLGHLFDTLGRKKMIAGTYLISGCALAFSAWLFDAAVLDAAGQTVVWIVVFFFASAGASAGYLTVSEIFPIEIRAEAIAVFFAIAQCFGAVGPILYGFLIGSGDNRTGLTIGYLIGGGIMIIGGIVEVFLGINAEGKSLETVARPLTEVDSGGSTS
jgi:MFS family permease